MIDFVEKKAEKKYAYWYRLRPGDVTPDEYMAITALVFIEAAQEYGIVDAPTGKPTEAQAVMYRLSKHLFEEQGIVDIYEQDDFIRQLLPYSPHYIGRYL